MTPEMPPGEKGFLWRSLAQGAEPFHFRNRVRSLLGFPDSGSVEMIFSQPLPIAGFNYVVPQFSGEFEIPDEFFGSSRSSSRTTQTVVPNLTPAGPRKPAQQEYPARGEPSEAFSNQPSKQPSLEAGMELTSAAPRRSAEARSDKPQRETSSGGKAETLPAPQTEFLPPRTEPAIARSPATVRRHEEILPDLPRRKAAAKGEAPDQEHVSLEPQTAGTPQPTTFAERPPSRKSFVPSRSVPSTDAPASSETATTARPAQTTHVPANTVQQRQFREVVPPTTASPASNETSTTPRPAQTTDFPANPVQQRQFREVVSPSMPARTQSLVAKSRPQQQQDLAPAFAGLPSAQRSESRPGSDNRRFSENRRPGAPETFVTRQAPTEPATPPPVVVVKQSSEPVAAAFWERRYLSHLHLRIRR